MVDYAEPPANVTLTLKPFHAHVDDEGLQHFRALLELSSIAPAVFENTRAGRKLGVERTWLENAKRTWLNDFDWRKHEDRINSFPNFKATVEDGARNKIEVHFLALFSRKPDAVPVAFLHGWPGSFCEFLDILDLLRARYPPAELPYHVIVPSLPGYAYSSDLPVDVDYSVEMAAGAVHNLMVGLGFGSGYLAQGGDLGSFISRILALKFEACRGMHVNMMGMPAPGGDDDDDDDDDDSPPTEQEEKVMQKLGEVLDTGYAFFLEQGQRSATIGLALSASPLALLCWIGEKFLEWADGDPPLDKILEAVTLYWFTDTYSRCMYHNRGMGSANDAPKIARMSMLANGNVLKLPYVEKPCGYSAFAHEIIPSPKSWAMKSCNLVSYHEHDRGGHFAAMERPQELLADVEDYIRKAWKAS